MQQDLEVNEDDKVDQRGPCWRQMSGPELVTFKFHYRSLNLERGAMDPLSSDFIMHIVRKHTNTTRERISSGIQKPFTEADTPTTSGKWFVLICPFQRQPSFVLY